MGHEGLREYTLPCAELSRFLSKQTATTRKTSKAETGPNTTATQSPGHSADEAPAGPGPGLVD